MYKSMVLEGATYANPINRARCPGGTYGNNIGRTCVPWTYDYTIICVHCHTPLIQVDHSGNPVPVQLAPHHVANASAWKNVSGGKVGGGPARTLGGGAVGTGSGGGSSAAAFGSVSPGPGHASGSGLGSASSSEGRHSPRSMSSNRHSSSGYHTRYRKAYEHGYTDENGHGGHGSRFSGNANHRHGRGSNDVSHPVGDSDSTTLPAGSSIDPSALWRHPNGLY